MDFEVRPAYTCPMFSIVTVDWLKGAYVIKAQQSNVTVLVPLRGEHKGVVIPSCPAGLRCVAIDSLTEVSLLWADPQHSFNGDCLFEDLPEENLISTFNQSLNH